MSKRALSLFLGVAPFAVLAGCGNASGGNSGDGVASAEDGDGESGDASADATQSGTGDGDGDGDGEGETGNTKFDVGGQPDAGDSNPGPTCKVVDGMDAIGECEESAPPDSFEPDVQWGWDGQDGDVFAVITPLVANLTDDNDDGEIDLCDVPDVVTVAWPTLGAPAHMYILDGETGSVHVKLAETVDFSVTPVIGDIDDDGIPEIVTTQGTFPIAFEHDGTLKWKSATAWTGSYIGSMAMADMDNDGDVEIIAGNMIYDEAGTHVITMGGPAGPYSASTAADLDDDGDLELVLGASAYHHDGGMVYSTNVAPGFPHVADLDDDPQPEILVTNGGGLSLIDHDGTVQYQDLKPTGDSAWNRPATVHDFDGDGDAEYAVSSANHYSVFEADASIKWSSDVSDLSGVAAGTAFDFLGDGDAEAMYADESFLFIFDGNGDVLLQSPRTSRTGTEYPVVADVDNDGSAEIVVVSNEPISGGNMDLPPPVQVIRDVEDRWIQARRIWNQHAYHVTNVREDGTIPQFEPPSWEALNTFRTNAQIEGGGVCKPPPPG